MALNRPLLRWQIRRIRGITLVGLIVAFGYVCTATDVLQFGVESPAAYFIGVHCLLITWRLGRTETQGSGFLYTQGFSRDVLWRHTMLAGLVSVLAAWLPSALLILSGLRSQWQAALGNPWLPLFAASERVFVAWCLLEYAVLLPAFHYMWVREWQMSRDPTSGFVVAGCLVVAGLGIWGGVRMHWMPFWTQGVIAGGLLTAGIALLIAGRFLNGTREVVS